MLRRIRRIISLPIDGFKAVFSPKTASKSGDKNCLSDNEFSSLGLSKNLAKTTASLGWKKPTPIQKEAIPVAISGKDLLGCAQTGSGKTAAFGLPILQKLSQPSHKKGIRALVLVPTRELATQVDETFCMLSGKNGPKTAVVIGGVGYEGQTRAIAKGATILIATPGRLLDHLERRNFNLNNIDVLVLDEADRMLDMGFMPDISNIISRLPKTRQTMLFSATLLPEIEHIASFALRSPVTVSLASPKQTAEGVCDFIYPVAPHQKPELIVALLRSIPDAKSVLIFTRTKARADRVEHQLNINGFHAGILHSDISQGQRTRVMSGFRDGTYRILVATDIAARGLDVPDISHVINYDVPSHPEDYVHRVGRTARANARGQAFTMLDIEENDYLCAIEGYLGRIIPRKALPGFRYIIPPNLTPSKRSLSRIAANKAADEANKAGMVALKAGK